MMKYLLTVYALLCLLLSACSTDSAGEYENSEVNTILSDSSWTETVKLPESKEQPDIYICYGSVSFSDTEYNEYLHHISTCDKIPENFVCYEQLQQIGAFSRFLAPAHGHPANDVFYMYFFVDEWGQPISLSVETAQKRDLSDPEKATTAVDPRDMRYLTEEKSGRSVYSAGDINYCYIDGELYYIEWYANDLSFRVQCEYEADVAARICNYPAECSGTFMSKMLSLDTASQAVADFIDAINTCALTE